MLNANLKWRNVIREVTILNKLKEVDTVPDIIDNI
jgi:hypothetical protein